MLNIADICVVQVRVGEALELVGCGFGTILYNVGCYLVVMSSAVPVAALAIIGLVVKCEWRLTPMDIAVLQMTPSVAQGISGLLTSNLGDLYGRRRVILVATTAGLGLGALSGAVANYWSLIVLTSLATTMLGLTGGPCQAFAGEISPSRFRGLALSASGLGYGIASFIISGLAYLTLDAFGWQGYLSLSYLIFFPAAVIFFIIRESPFFSVRQGKVNEAETTINSIRRMNSKSEPDIVLKAEPVNIGQHQTGNIVASYRTLVETGHRDQFWYLVSMTLASQFTYNAILFVAPLFLHEGYCVRNFQADKSDCGFDKSILFDLGIVGISEPLTVLIATILMDIIGRRPTFMISAVLSTVLPTGIYFCVSSTWLITFLALTKGALSALSLASFVICAEKFPTNVRSFTSSVVSSLYSLSVVGAVLVTQFLYPASPRAVVALFQVTGLLVCGLLSQINTETMGQVLD